MVRIIEIPDIESEYSPSEDVATIRAKRFDEEKRRAHQMLEQRIQMIRSDYRQMI